MTAKLQISFVSGTERFFVGDPSELSSAYNQIRVRMKAGEGSGCIFNDGKGQEHVVNATTVESMVLFGAED
ncbi:hypothetical protein [Maritalea sp.]|jgi:hypothetical protein|uniref:hypothetical protein n=1 Tax=Maritalea sp. TaxID=2003361 RepID=UPI0039E683F5